MSIKPKFIVSLTTSPQRISKIKPMVFSILNQSRNPDLFILNIPKTFHRTGETYTIPDFITNNNITVNMIDQDYGPATKIIPTVTLLKEENYDSINTYIIYLDDDVIYRPHMLKTLQFLFSIHSNTKQIFCGGGFNFVINNKTMKIIGQRTHHSPCHIAEGYAAVCVPLSVFENDFDEYVEKYTLCISNDHYVDCRLSDDVILSNYYHMKKVPIKIVNIPGGFSIFDIWKEKCILDYGNDKDALHNGANGISSSNYQRYLNVLNTLVKDRNLYIKCKQE